MNSCLPRKEGSPWDSLLSSKVSYRTVYPEKLFPWPPVLVGFWESCELLHLRGMLNFFLCFRSELATDEVVLHMGQFAWIVKFALRMFTFMTLFGENKLWQQQNFFLTRIDFAVAVSSRAVRVFPALSLRRVRPSYGTFSLMVFQGNCAWGRKGHMINVVIMPIK